MDTNLVIPERLPQHFEDMFLELWRSTKKEDSIATRGNFTRTRVSTGSYRPRHRRGFAVASLSLYNCKSLPRGKSIDEISAKCFNIHCPCEQKSARQRPQTKIHDLALLDSSPASDKRR